MKLTVVLGYYEAKESYSRIGLLQSYRNLQSYWSRSSGSAALVQGSDPCTRLFNALDLIECTSNAYTKTCDIILAEPGDKKNCENR